MYVHIYGYSATLTCVLEAGSIFGSGTTAVVLQFHKPSCKHTLGVSPVSKHENHIINLQWNI